MPDTERVFLKPADIADPADPDGKRRIPRKVRNPATGRHMPAEGELVAPDTYWRRRLRDGDVAEAKPPRPEPKAAEKKEPSQ